ncbi:MULTISPECIES: histidine phosphatase family protein [Saccharothrix]|uniref:Histidine phosphatase family protein n=2 Tax=Saccharothrix TaxID=2071 RepID=A0ABU0WYK0_9PSEU|nr:MULTISPECIES: histidine phosphatase family protein [Saccharothrix]MDQ2584583.1 histidine phosphatase family protein [Saccharothrix yanglingensis]MDR6597996.1 broad specificity phosphatase PhoE [Saccharothrix longispora]
MRIILLRHGQSLGNVDESAYCRIPDHALPLTPVGEREARDAGPRVKRLLAGAPVAVYVSPYVRTRATLRNLALGDQAERVVAEPRLREQDWGNLQDPVQQEVLKHQRHAFGHFFFRLPNGESGADVDDRLAAFLTDLETRMGAPEHPETALVVSHGLTIRLLCRRLFGWSIELFESLSNPNTCEERVLWHDGAAWRLDRPFEQWRTSPDGETQT